MRKVVIRGMCGLAFGLILDLFSPTSFALIAYRINITAAQYPESDPDQQALLVMIQALQGIANRNCADKIWYQWQNNPLWMTWVHDHYGVNFNDAYASDPWGLLNHFKAQAGISQYIVYDIYQSSQNVARSLAGVLKVIPVTPTWVATAQSYGLTQALDVRGRDEAWMYSNYWSSFNQYGLIEQYEGHPCQQFLGDWAAYRRYFMYYDGNSSFRHMINAAAVDHSFNYGWGMDEFNWVQDCSQNNITPVVANFSEDFSVLEQLGDKRAAQKSAVHASPTLIPQAGKHYVAIVMSDGDNIQWLQRDFTWPNWWSNSHRGQFKMNWEINASCLDCCPPVIQYYFAQATNNDFFVTGPSGTSYMYPKDYPDKDGYVDKMNNFIRESDLHVVSVLNNGTNKSNCDKWAQVEETLGIIYKPYANYYKGAAGVRWVSGKPIKGYDFVMWEGSGYPASATEIAGEINARPANPTTDQNSYSLVNVHAWSYWGGTSSGSSVMDNVAILVGNLASHVQAVTAEELFIMMRNQFGTPVVDTSLSEWVYQAESISHDIGRADSDGWSANVAQDGPGYLCRGATLNTISGASRVYFELMIDILNANNDQVVTCEVWENTTKIAGRDIYRHNFSSDRMYKEFRVDFTAAAGHSYEFRTYWWDTSYVRQDYIRVVGIYSAPPGQAPIISEVSPDPDSATVGVEYTKQLILIQGTPPINWSVVSGPSGIAVNSNGYVYGWTPDAGDIGNRFTFEIQASNSEGSDVESWGIEVYSKSDFDRDRDVDLEDFGHFQACYLGPGMSYKAGCEDADLNGDSDVDLDDFTTFQACMGGANRQPGC